MRCIKRISSCFRRMSNEHRRVKMHYALIVGLLFVALAIFTWSFGGETHRILTLYIFPKYSLPLPVMYVLWSLFYFMLGYIVVGLMCVCESYKRLASQKIALIMIMSAMFSYVSYLLFFSAVSSFMAFVLMLISTVFCVFAFVESKRLFCFWSVLIFVYLVWTIYNALIPLGFVIIN